MAYLNLDCIRAASAEAFQHAQPYPWVDLKGTLTAEGFQRLRESLPEETQFERRVAVKRAFGQGYHDRYILHYRPGVTVSAPWQEFWRSCIGRRIRPSCGGCSACGPTSGSS